MLNEKFHEKSEEIQFNVVLPITGEVRVPHQKIEIKNWPSNHQKTVVGLDNYVILILFKYLF